eukprot:11895216-Alexandrium_andersonii.AAC.1
MSTYGHKSEHEHEPCSPLRLKKRKLPVDGTIIAKIAHEALASTDGLSAKLADGVTTPLVSATCMALQMRPRRPLPLRLGRKDHYVATRHTRQGKTLASLVGPTPPGVHPRTDDQTRDRRSLRAPGRGPLQ